MNLEVHLKPIREKKRRGEELIGESVEDARALIERIRNGDGIGDLIADFAVVYGGFEKEQREPQEDTLREFGEEIRRNQSGLALIFIQEKEEHDMCKTGPVSSMSPRPVYKAIRGAIVLGVLNGDLEIDVKNMRLMLPMESHVLYDTGPGKNRWELKEGKMGLNASNVLTGGSVDFAESEMVSREMAPYWGNVPLSSIVESFVSIGDEEVMESLRRQGGLDGLVRLEPRKTRVSYLEAFDLLGREVPADLREEHDKGRYEERVGIIEGIEGIIKDGLESNYSGAIKDYLMSAVELDLHKTPWVLDRGPGKTLDVPAYLAPLFEKYNVPVPESSEAVETST